VAVRQAAHHVVGAIGDAEPCQHLGHPIRRVAFLLLHIQQPQQFGNQAVIERAVTGDQEIVMNREVGD